MLFSLVVNPAAGKGTPKTLAKAMGDVNNGVHLVNLSFTNIAVNPTDTVVFNYLIVNSGHTNPSQIETTLGSTGTSLLAVGGAIADWLGGKIVKHSQRQLRRTRRRRTEHHDL